MANASLVGRKVTTAEVVRALDSEFPGWGKPGEFDHFVDHPEGSTATIVGIEQHGSAPFTRYVLSFPDGSRTAGGRGPNAIVWPR